MKLAKKTSAQPALALGGLLVVATLGCAQSNTASMETKAPAVASSSRAKVMVSPSPVPYQRKVKVSISGSGFAPNQELELLIPIGGVLSDISSIVKPTPKTDAKGTFSTVWILDNEIRGKLMEPTGYTLEIASPDGETLATVPFVLQKVASKKP